MRLDTKLHEIQLYRIIKLLNASDTVGNSPSKVYEWMNTVNMNLNRLTPMDLLMTGSGLRVIRYLQSQIGLNNGQNI